MAPPVSIAKASASISSTAVPWQRLTVAQFLTQINWQNQPQPAPEVPPPAATPGPAVAPELSYRLTVGQFFRAIPWQGVADSPQADTLPEVEASPDGLPNLRSNLPAELPDLDEFADGAANGGDDLTLDDIFGDFA